MVSLIIQTSETHDGIEHGYEILHISIALDDKTQRKRVKNMITVNPLLIKIPTVDDRHLWMSLQVKLSPLGPKHSA